MGAQNSRIQAFAQREERILNAALRLFVGDGWQDVTVESIAKGAGIGKGTVYRHFPSKEDLYLRLAMRHEAALASALDLVSVQNPVERLRKLLSAWWAVTIEPSPYRLLVQHCERREVLAKVSPVNRARWLRVRQRIDTHFTDTLDAVAERGAARQAAGGRWAHYPVRALLNGLRDSAWQDEFNREQPSADLDLVERFVLNAVVRPDVLTHSGNAPVSDMPQAGAAA